MSMKTRAKSKSQFSDLQSNVLPLRHAPSGCFCSKDKSDLKRNTAVNVRFGFDYVETRKMRIELQAIDSPGATIRGLSSAVRCLSKAIHRTNECTWQKRLPVLVQIFALLVRLKSCQRCQSPLSSFGRFRLFNDLACCLPKTRERKHLLRDSNPQSSD